MPEEKKEIAQDINIEEKDKNRRDFIKDMGVAALTGAAALVTGSDDAQAQETWAEFFQKNYRLMTDEEKKLAFREELEEGSKILDNILKSGINFTIDEEELI